MTFSYTPELLSQALTYDQYRAHISQVLANPHPSEKEEKMLPYYRKGAALMDEYIQSYRVNKPMLESLRIAKPVTWLVLTEGWCGDAGFITPLLRLIENEAHGKINLRFLLKDAHPDLMDAHLTNGGRSIPKLIVLNEELEELATWGPRPQALQKEVLAWKEAGTDLKELIAQVDAWYREDNTLEIQHELRDLIYDYSGRRQNIERLEHLNRLISYI